MSLVLQHFSHHRASDIGIPSLGPCVVLIDPVHHQRLHKWTPLPGEDVQLYNRPWPYSRCNEGSTGCRSSSHTCRFRWRTNENACAPVEDFTTISEISFSGRRFVSYQYGRLALLNLVRRDPTVADIAFACCRFVANQYAWTTLGEDWTVPMAMAYMWISQSSRRRHFVLPFVIRSVATVDLDLRITFHDDITGIRSHFDAARGVNIDCSA